MKTNINKWTENLSVKEKIFLHEQTIFDKDIWIEDEMRKIAEVTYSYTTINPETKEKLQIKWEDININTTLFCSLWELDLNTFCALPEEKKLQSILNACNILQNKISHKVFLIQNAIADLENIKNWKISKEEKYTIDIFINSLLEKVDLFDYCLNWIVYELQKAWDNIQLREEDIKKIDKIQKELDKKLYWWEIQDKTKEVIWCFDYMLWKYKENKHKLTLEERERYEYFLKKIKVKLPKNYNYNKKNKLHNCLDQYKEVNIQDNEYILWFNLFIEALEKLKHVVKRDHETKSISDWPLWVQFPTTDKFKQLTIKRFLTLNTHEIETHNITDHNNEQIIWNIRWAWSTIKDEGLAILMEILLQYWENLFKKDEKTWKKIIDIDALPIKNTFTYVLMWELLNNDELLEFLTLNEKIEPDTIEIQARFDRLKRSNNNLVQHKDTSYIRWLFQAAKEINKYILSNWKEWISIEDMFLWKVWFDEIHKLKAIKEEKEQSWEKLDIIMPIFSSDTILFSIEKRPYLLKKEEISKEEFLKYLKNKYPIFDFTKEQIEAVSAKTKQNIAWVINITLKNINENWIKQLYAKNNQLDILLDILLNKHHRVIKNVHNKMHQSRRKATEEKKEVV